MSDYLITMDTGEQYLMHHGVKGMKWGEWNAETAARYSGTKRNAKQSVDDVVSKAKNKSVMQEHQDARKSFNSLKERYGANSQLKQKFDKALKDNPKLRYDDIYKEMGVDTRSEDPDVYREAEAEWYKKHGYK